MIVTQEIFDLFKPGEVMKVVTTKIQQVYEPMKVTLKFIVKKGEGGMDWAIYCGKPTDPDWMIMQVGDKVTGKETIQSLMPCTQEVMELYRK